ncbi:hypothetical protein PoB_005340800 [Plakobranchus ocellatus]|uniref:Uncharacterized protein n=1 Tax=Plakobranchus ocellatus TaxID=259542 RepID=A0AAV4C4S2_9GAST|nr:hypothetical protein PoB_005340800 [Plakobranchus ocellatus]
MLRVPELVVLVSVATILLLLSQTAHGLPTRNIEQERNSDVLRSSRDWVDVFNRIRKKYQIDAGFLSRHNAINRYLKAYDAHKAAMNPYGPGRRK